MIEAPAAADQDLGLYVHFPWCVRKCPYCDFNSHPLRGNLDEGGYRHALLKDLENQLRTVADDSIGSVFFGGGTPSLFEPETFAIVLGRIERYLQHDAEITMEANPGTTEHKDFGGYLRAGINRLSLGAQSFDEAQLQRLGRVHGTDDILRSVEAARSAGIDNVNLDLMYGLPRQSVDGALADLEQAIALAPDHLSWYQLTIEPKTEFARRPPPPVAEDDLAAMEAAGYRLLADNGFSRYEVSAFARPARQCRHNLNYWTFGDYLGVGAGAHGKRSRPTKSGVLVTRTSKARQPRLYLEKPQETMQTPVATKALGGEFVLNALRLTEGVSARTFTERTGLDTSALQPAWSELAAQGLLETERLAATEIGFRYLDSLIDRFL